MTNTSDSFRNVTRYLGQDYRFVPTYLRTRDPITPATSPDVKPKEQQGRYPITSLWTNTSNQNIWALAGIVNNLGKWVLISSGGVGPLLKVGVPLGTSPISPDVNGLMNFTSTAGTIQITGSAGGLGAQNINFDITGGAVAIEKVNVDASTPPGTNPVVPTAGAITVTGGQVAAGTTANVIQTNSLAASTYTVQIQRSQAVASSTIGDNGVSHFSNADFKVDANGFVQAFNSFVYTSINHASSPYTVLATDYYISCDPTAGVISILLPNAPVTFRQFVIKDRTGKASTSNISVTTVGGAVTIDGQTTYTMAGNFDAIELIFNGTSYEIF